MRQRMIGGIPFIPYEHEGDIEKAASELRRRGYYVRRIGDRLWVLRNPRWFYKFMNL